jgi:thioredoxin
VLGGTKQALSKLIHIESSNFESDVLASSQPVVLDFWGPRCVPCVQLDPFVEEIADEVAGLIKLVKVVAPENPGICTQLGVKTLPTFLAMHGGTEIGRVAGGAASREGIRALIDELLGRSVASA